MYPVQIFLQKSRGVGYIWPGSKIPDRNMKARYHLYEDYRRNIKVKVSQSCPTLCDPMDYTVHGILQARILALVAFSFSRGSSQPRD